MDNPTRSRHLTPEPSGVRCRDLTLDAIAGLFITIMMFGHFNIVSREPWTFGHFFMFNTTWFFYKSGMFHRPVKLNNSRIAKWLKRLFIPFLTCSLFGVTVSFICLWITSGSPNFHIFYGAIIQILEYGAPWWNLPLWFLLTLLFVKIITSRYDGRHTFMYLLVAAAVFSIHYFMSDTHRFSYIGNTALATFFYILGYKTKNINFNRYMTYWIFGVLFIAIFILYPSILDSWSNKALSGNYFLAILATFLGIVLVNKIFYFCRISHIRPLIFMGENAMLFLVLHVPFYLAFQELFKSANLSPTEMNWCGAVFSIICCLLTYMFLKRHRRLKWLIGG